MALVALMSPGGAPGVTTTALALTYGWGRRALVAECDPQGGRVLWGFLKGRVEPPHGGLLGLAQTVVRDPDPGVIWDHVVPLDRQAREWLLLPGLADLREAPLMESAWPGIAATLSRANDYALDVVADVGGVGLNTPMQLIAACDLTVMVLRPTLPQIMAARSRVDLLSRELGSTASVALCLIGTGEYRPGEISEVLYGVPVMAALPYDPIAAGVLSDGRQTRRPLRSSALLRKAAGLAADLRHQLGPKAATRSEVS